MPQDDVVEDVQRREGAEPDQVKADDGRGEHQDPDQPARLVAQGRDVHLLLLEMQLAHLPERRLLFGFRLLRASAFHGGIVGEAPPGHLQPTQGEGVAQYQRKQEPERQQKQIGKGRGGVDVTGPREGDQGQGGADDQRVPDDVRTEDRRVGADWSQVCKHAMPGMEHPVQEPGQRQVAKKQTKLGQGPAALGLIDTQRKIDDEDRGHERPNEQLELSSKQRQVMLRPAEMRRRQPPRSANGAEAEQNGEVQRDPHQRIAQGVGQVCCAAVGLKLPARGRQ